MGLAGCLDSDVEAVSIGIPGDSSTTGQSTQALQAVVQNESDSVRFDAQDSGGDPASIRLYNNGEIDGYSASNFISTNALNDEEPFEEDPVDGIAYQGFQIGVLDLHWLALDGSGIETTDDLLDEDITVWMLPPGWGLRQLSNTVHESIGIREDLEANELDADTGDIPGRVDEGDVDALISYGANGVNLPGWATEVDARSDLYAVETTEEFREGAAETDGVDTDTIDVYGYDQDIGADEVFTWRETFQFFFSADMPADVAYEVAEISHEHWEDARDAQEAYPDHSDVDNMASAYMSDQPVHPGVADFLEDQGAWDDSWTRGE
ncbi:TRAP transporter solute receptor, TAXI family protein [Natrialba hulunbeirensis JCM 10989]|uniref:TRAP transporter solute receptor, TAXI family protein n=1 Tax=Natrialba hulunbeirensis JCM 10989 TaxID=1227493 RepID=M0A1C1_9EURY|nr:TRAP transporter substrate-binding protein [Natrialba hulunbeirensis]ELY92419.1 TRAP transporter solute receptor, TAXI family protein [Natrialba hulunbeirensis JCM 10989]